MSGRVHGGRNQQPVRYRKPEKSPEFLNKKGVFILNAEVIETIEETPDTVVTLINGKKLIVDEPMDEVVRRVMAYRRALHK